ncbi:oligopeptide transport system permease protein AppC [Neobacillus bataviensis LMG 21833]|uniref:Oligopeptide transport system permease protein AppC n=1 Tax=Neobacillus bataviensis LMG 21833 TaxID=1117379 RepID=K6E044_9BACI|nr:ABC transporter permease [Neobacillus bataviensis]EKN66491.1 oligopeptide transport system permease protein AppC [Neobacillus bataviensis LMG 21833]
MSTTVMKMKEKKTSLFKIRAKKMWSNKLAAMGLAICLVMILLAIFAPLFTKYSPTQMDLTSITHPPSAEHLFGTDKLGRDVFAQILYGARVSIYVGIMSSLGGTLIGVILGCLAGYFGGKLDNLLTRLSEIAMTFPELILVLVMVAMLGQGVSNLIIVFMITGWMTTFRLVRNEFLSVREETYVSVCRSFGISNLSIIFKHMLPNTMSPIIVAFTVNVAGYVLAEAGLSFLGLGVPVTTPTWGNIMNAAQSIDVITNFWWLWLAPGLAISLFVLAINFLGDGLRDVLDPKQ